MTFKRKSRRRMHAEHAENIPVVIAAHLFCAFYVFRFAISAVNSQRGKPTELSYNARTLFLFLISNVLNLGAVEIRPPDVLKSHM